MKEKKVLALWRNTNMMIVNMWLFCTAVLLGSMKNACFTAVGAKTCMLHSSKICNVFWGVEHTWFSSHCSKTHIFLDPNRIAVQNCHMFTTPQRQHFFFLHPNLLTVFAVMLQTFSFLWTYRHCQALTYVMIIGLWLDRLLGNIFLHAFQQLSIVPVWASTFGFPLRERQTIFANWPLEWFTNSCWMFNFSAVREGRRPH